MTPEPNRPIFLPDFDGFNRPARIVTLGAYHAREQRAGKVAETRGIYTTASEQSRLRENLGWTRLIDALNKGRQWPLKRLTAQISPMLDTEIALCIVPSHAAFHMFSPLRELARALATDGRTDATACLVRTQTIRRIVFGGVSTQSLHTQTIRVESAEIFAGRRVLLLDDIAKSGASLMACRALLLDAGASQVQALALGRLTIDREPFSKRDENV